MADPRIHELRERATKLRAFADHVQKLPDRVDGEAAKMEWSGPYTDKVRGEIKTWKGRCGSVADRIREEAQRLDGEASSLEQKEREKAGAR